MDRASIIEDLKEYLNLTIKLTDNLIETKELLNNNTRFSFISGYQKANKNILSLLEDLENEYE